MGKHNKVSKHSQDEVKTKIEISKKKVIAIITVLLVLIVIIVCTIFFSKTDNDVIANIPIINDILPTDKGKTEKDENVVVEEMQEKMGRYNVLGILKIDKLGLEKEILDETTDESLNLAVTKFYGPELNKIGNFCITGHNYKNIFGYLDNLELEDTFEITDKAELKTITYKVYDKYIVNTDELDCLSQETEGKKEVTLITCTPGGITRLIIKAKEI